RLYDWGRVYGSGVSRELHIRKGTEAVDWSRPGCPVPLGDGGSFDDLKAAYSIVHVQGEKPLALQGGAVFFLSSGEASFEGEVEAPACLIADRDGGEFTLRGRGYIIEP
ncbi:MAG: hypothetical protein JXR55_09440, partial [Candidatus Fermentibacteraceae bacterium]|nr:hypothetical protein [Candidatus Fermentibacteraceae bacterium]